MAMCEKLEKCPFYQGKMTMDSGIGSIFKKKYCEGDKTICARYIVATTLGPNFVPDTLFPKWQVIPASYNKASNPAVAPEPRKKESVTKSREFIFKAFNSSIHC